MLYRITLPYAVFGVVVENNKVVQTAPIAAWAQGKNWARNVKPFFERKGAIIICTNQKIQTDKL